MNNVDKQYLDLLQDIMCNGVYKETRSGAVRSVFGRMMRFNLQDGLPILTTKKVFTKGFIHELIWFLNGDENIKYMVDNNVHIWDDDAYRYFRTYDFRNNIRVDIYGIDDNGCYITDGKGFKEYGIQKFIIDNQVSLQKNTEFYSYSDLKEKVSSIDKETFINYVKNEYKIYYGIENENKHYVYPIYTFGDLGPVYGWEWRNWNGIDQIQNIIDTLKTNPNDRRIILSAWNVGKLRFMALPHCHYFAQFYTRPLTNMERLDWLCEHSNGEYDEWKIATVEKLDELNVPKYGLSCMLNCRSQDVPLGTVGNWVSYSILTNMIAQCVNMIPDEFIWIGGDCHIYENQIEGVKEQLTRDPYKYNLPKLWLNPDIKNIDDFTFADIKIEGYESYPSIKFPLTVG